VSRTLWLTLPFGSAEYRVCAADRDDVDLASESLEEGPCEGATLHDSCTILIRRDLHRKRIPEVLFHEMGHVVAHLSGISTTLRWKLATEERVVHALSPLFAHGLVGGGLLKLPRFPR
jgi:hypothetical protein